MASPATVEAQRVAAGFRSTVGKPDTPQLFSRELLVRAKELHHRSPKDYEELVALILKSLELMTPSSGNGNEVLAAAAGLGVLLELELSTGQLSDCYNHIRICLSNVDCNTVTKVAAVFGRYLSLSSPNDQIRKQIENAVQWLAEVRTESSAYLRKLSAVHLLSQAARNMPLAFMPYLPEFFANVWTPLCDGQSELRDCALELFRAGIQVLNSRPRSVRQRIYTSLFAQLRQHLGSKNVDHIIGGLLAFEHVVLGSVGSHESRYDEAMAQVWPHRAHNVQYVRQLVMRALTVLAKYGKQLFVEASLKLVVIYALDSVQKEGDRAPAFKMLSDIICEVGSVAYDPHLDQTILAIKQALIQQKRQQKAPVWEVLECLSTICKVTPSANVEAHVKSCIEHVFGWGLSQNLISNLRDIVSSSSEETQVKVQEHLLDMISMTLCGMQFRQRPGAELLVAPSNEPPSPEKIVVALNALGEFDFRNSELMGDFLRDSVMSFLDSEFGQVRHAAISTISKLLLPSGGDISISRRIIIDHVIGRLLVVAIADPDVSVRKAILYSFHERFHPYLAEAQYLRHLFTATSDECFDVRLRTIELLCDLLDLNPSNILPMMRKQFILVINGLNSSQADVTVEGLRLLAMFAEHAPDIVGTFISSVTPSITALLSTALRNSPTTIPLLDALAATAKAVGPTLNKGGVASLAVNKVCDILVTLSFDKSIQTVRRRGLATIAAVLQFCGESVCPYRSHPTLFKLVTTIVLNKDENHECRLEALRIMGIVGALDPHKLDALQLEKREGAAIFSSEGTFGPLSHPMSCRVVLAALSDAMNPASSSISANTQSLMRSAIKTLLLVCERCPCSAPEIHVVFPSMVDMLLDMPDGTLFTTILYTVSELVLFAGRPVLQHAGVFFSLVEGLWNSGRAHAKLGVLKLGAALFDVEGEEHAGLTAYLPKIMPLFLEEFAQARNDALGHAALEFLLSADSRLHPFAAPLVRAATGLIDNPLVPIGYVSLVITTLQQLARKPWLHDFAAPIMRSVTQRLASFLATTLPTPTEAHPFVRDVIGLFIALLLQLQGDFAKFVPSTHRLLKAHRIVHGEFQYMCSQVLKNIKVSINNKTRMSLDGHYFALTKELAATFKAHKQSAVEVWALDEHSVDLAAQHASSAAGVVSNTSLSATHTSCNNNNSVMCSGGLHGESAAKFVGEGDAPMPIVREAEIIEKTKQSFPSKSEWRRWFDSLCLDILRESPHNVYRCVSMHINSPSIAERAPAFVSAIINPAFRCFWTYASSNMRFHLRECFERVLPNNNAPDDVVLAMLSIAEFMDIAGSPLPVSPVMLSAVAQTKGVLAKAIAWKEMHYRENPGEAAQGLITLYGEGDLEESATGLLNLRSGAEKDSLWQSSMLKLRRFEEALRFIEIQEGLGSASHSPTALMSAPIPPRAKHSRTRSWSTTSEGTGSFSHVEDPTVAKRMEIEVSKIECLSELGEMHRVIDEWNTLHMRWAMQSAVGSPTSNSKRVDDEEEESILHYIARYAAEAAIRLGDWGVTQDAVKWMRDDDIRLHIACCALAIHRREWDAASKCLVKGRDILLDDVSSLLHESYSRAYETIVIAQQLVELEEAMEVLKVGSTTPRGSARMAMIKELWDDRISSMAPDVSAWKRVLGTRRLLIAPQSDIANVIKFARLCREQKKHIMERFALEQMLGCRSPTKEMLLDRQFDPRVVFEYVKYLSSCNELGKHTVYGDEKALVRRLLNTHRGKSGLGWLEARMHVRCGDKSSDLHSSIQCYKNALDTDGEWSRAWHFWARANAEMLNNSYSHQRCADAIEGYVNSIRLAPTTSSMIQDVLKLLSLWGQHCDHSRALAELRGRIFKISVSTWLLVVPQLIAKLDTGSDESCQLVAEILRMIAKERPQNLIYPLTVCTSSNNERRKRHANKILQTMKEHFPQLVAQGGMVSSELIRIAMLHHEEWHAKLEEAATCFFNKQDPQAMVELLLPLHDEMNRDPVNIIEVDFFQKYARQLKDARDWLKSYQRTKDIADINSAWFIYHAVYKAIDQQIKSASKLQLQYCSPRLWEARDLELTIPHARPKDGDEAVRIAAFDPDIYVISSKQRPRRIAMIGTDGRPHKFLLKGREDLRLDERVMQLFKLVNTLLLTNASTNKISGYQIQRYSVTPLWDMVGLLGWVEECDTIHELVASYRTQRDVPVELELRLLGQVVPELPKAYDVLSVMQKVEVLEYLQDSTSGQDLRRALWAAAATSEVWLARRTTFARSLATMSVVGYILGLGDRHPNNIMIQRSTGKVVHIDFGDCFEVAMTRDKFPERVPFRLTRMLRCALDAPGVEGLFRTSAETVMAVLRDSRTSVTAMLEAFVHDPLISWRLVKKPMPRAEDGPAAVAAANSVGTASPSSAEHIMSREATVAPDPSSDPAQFGASISVATRIQIAMDQEEEIKNKKMQEEISHEGVAIMRRLQSKLRGRDFPSITDGTQLTLSPQDQVARLIGEATDVNNVAQSWSGWYPFW